MWTIGQKILTEQKNNPVYIEMGDVQCVEEGSNKCVKQHVLILHDISRHFSFHIFHPPPSRDCSELCKISQNPELGLRNVQHVTTEIF